MANNEPIDKIILSVEAENNVDKGIKEVEGLLRNFQQRIKSSTSFSFGIDTADLVLKINNVKKEIEKAVNLKDTSLEIQLRADLEVLNKQLAKSRQILGTFAKDGEGQIRIVQKLFKDTANVVDKTTKEFLKLGKDTSQLDKISTELKSLKKDFVNGELSVSEYGQALGKLQTQSTNALGGLNKVSQFAITGQKIFKDFEKSVEKSRIQLLKFGGSNTTITKLDNLKKSADDLKSTFLQGDISLKQYSTGISLLETNISLLTKEQNELEEQIKNTNRLLKSTELKLLSSGKDIDNIKQLKDNVYVLNKQFIEGKITAKQFSDSLISIQRQSDNTLGGINKISQTIITGKNIFKDFEKTVEKSRIQLLKFGGDSTAIDKLNSLKTSAKDLNNSFLQGGTSLKQYSTDISLLEQEVKTLTKDQNELGEQIKNTNRILKTAELKLLSSGKDAESIKQLKDNVSTLNKEFIEGKITAKQFSDSLSSIQRQSDSVLGGINKVSQSVITGKTIFKEFEKTVEKSRIQLLKFGGDNTSVNRLNQLKIGANELNKSFLQGKTDLKQYSSSISLLEYEIKSLTKDQSNLEQQIKDTNKVLKSTELRLLGKGKDVDNIKRLQAQVSSLNNDFIAGKITSQQFSEGLNKIGHSASQARGKLNGFGNGIKRILAYMTGFYVFSQIETLFRGMINTTIEFETALVGVKKTVEGTPAQFDELDKKLKKLSVTLGVGYVELAKYAQIGGQMGIGIESIARFTETVAKLNLAVDSISGEDAAMQLARLINITGGYIDNIDRLASSLNYLGQNYNTFESNILAFSTDLAGLSVISSVTAQDILGISTAFTAAGIRAESGGTAILDAFLSINKAVISGSSQLNKFAIVSGKSSDKFIKDWEGDAANAFADMIEGLGTAGKYGGEVLNELGFQYKKIEKNFLLASGSADDLRKAIKDANEEFIRNTSLNEEVQKVLNSTAGKLGIQKQKWTLLGDTLGKTIMPTILKLAEYLTGVLGNAFVFLQAGIVTLRGAFLMEFNNIKKSVENLGTSIALVFVGIEKTFLKGARTVYESLHWLGGNIGVFVGNSITQLSDFAKKTAGFFANISENAVILGNNINKVFYNLFTNYDLDKALKDTVSLGKEAVNALNPLKDFFDVFDEKKIGKLNITAGIQDFNTGDITPGEIASFKGTQDLIDSVKGGMEDIDGLNSIIETNLKDRLDGLDNKYKTINDSIFKDTTKTLQDINEQYETLNEDLTQLDTTASAIVKKDVGKELAKQFHLNNTDLNTLEGISNSLSKAEERLKTLKIGSDEYKATLAEITKLEGLRDKAMGVSSKGASSAKKEEAKVNDVLKSQEEERIKQIEANAQREIYLIETSNKTKKEKTIAINKVYKEAEDLKQKATLSTYEYKKQIEQKNFDELERLLEEEKKLEEERLKELQELEQERYEELKDQAEDTYDTSNELIEEGIDNLIDYGKELKDLKKDFKDLKKEAIEDLQDINHEIGKIRKERQGILEEAAKDIQGIESQGISDFGQRSIEITSDISTIDKEIKDLQSQLQEKSTNIKDTQDLEAFNKQRIENEQAIKDLQEQRIKLQEEQSYISNKITKEQLEEEIRLSKRTQAQIIQDNINKAKEERINQAKEDLARKDQEIKVLEETASIKRAFAEGTKINIDEIEDYENQKLAKRLEQQRLEYITKEGLLKDNIQNEREQLLEFYKERKQLESDYTKFFGEQLQLQLGEIKNFREKIGTAKESISGIGLPKVKTSEGAISKYITDNTQKTVNFFNDIKESVDVDSFLRKAKDLFR